MQTISEGEDSNELYLQKELEPYIKGLIKCMEVVGMAVEAHPPIKLSQTSSSLKVVQTLLIKSTNDIRSLWILGAKGYSIQAATIASSLFESSIMINYIGDNDDLANEWIKHTNPAGLPKKLGAYTEEVFKKLVTDYDSATREQLDVYGILCRAKHGNPTLLKVHYYKLEDDTIVADYGPENGEESIKLTCFSIENSISFMMIALESFINNHLSKFQIDFSNLITKFEETRLYYDELVTTSIKRWGKTESDN
ncbi:hypothetical protein QCD85_09970 [Paenibacillus sp. PsM32]|uniref:hypothetical protein n=1 Tax=Paenibacillus sp. PsM32 TaxID=3030536 RepID=UPI00263AFE47|nr:hypothetical protein [Paenibacillus sp. PsM32]MDN4618424.1 hypothetical protein [Paenibacillus sp. PsM32]